MTGEDTDAPRRSKPDGSAWLAAQKDMTERNDAARKKGMQDRSNREREAAVRQHLRNQDRHAEL
jgi:hypothetical protein